MEVGTLPFEDSLDRNCIRAVVQAREKKTIVGKITLWRHWGWAAQKNSASAGGQAKRGGAMLPRASLARLLDAGTGIFS